MKIENLNLAYGEKKIFGNFTLDIQGGVTCIMGGSGTGKTTLLNCISSQLPYGGKITHGKANPKVAYVFQTPRLITSMSVEDNIKFVLPKEYSKEQVQATLDGIVAKLQLDDCRYAYPNKISGGQASRVSLARALATDCDILLLDEPFRGLDVKLKGDILNLLAEFVKNRCVVFVTHDVEEALCIADRICVLERKEGECVQVKGQVDIEQSRAARDVYGDSLNEIRRQVYGLLS